MPEAKYEYPVIITVTYKHPEIGTAKAEAKIIGVPMKLESHQALVERLLVEILKSVPFCQGKEVSADPDILAEIDPKWKK